MFSVCREVQAQTIFSQICYFIEQNLSSSFTLLMLNVLVVTIRSDSQYYRVAGGKWLFTGWYPFHKSKTPENDMFNLLTLTLGKICNS